MAEQEIGEEELLRRLEEKKRRKAERAAKRAARLAEQGVTEEKRVGEKSKREEAEDDAVPEPKRVARSGPGTAAELDEWCKVYYNSVIIPKLRASYPERTGVAGPLVAPTEDEVAQMEVAAGSPGALCAADLSRKVNAWCAKNGIQDLDIMGESIRATCSSNLCPEALAENGRVAEFGQRHGHLMDCMGISGMSSEAYVVFTSIFVLLAGARENSILLTSEGKKMIRSSDILVPVYAGVFDGLQGFQRVDMSNPNAGETTEIETIVHNMHNRRWDIQRIVGLSFRSALAIYAAAIALNCRLGLCTPADPGHIARLENVAMDLVSASFTAL